MSDERGMTIVEVLVAVLVLSVGLLALTTAAAAVTRMVDEGKRSTEAAALAAERVELLLADGCPVLGGGSTARGSFTVGWEVVAAAGERARAITVVVERTTPRGTRADTVRTLHSCP
jgi:prepilin-type N-terminal cleavage/methylation domain-containing protein